jgi:23S rRNA (uracil1939-C5)-methyltransferase
MWLHASEPSSVSQIVRYDTSEQEPAGAKTSPAIATVRIEKIVTGGMGLGRHNGRVLLIPLTAPGDVVEVALPGRGPMAELVRVIEAGPDRQAPWCAHYGVCGGCDLMHLTYEAQLEVKLAATLKTINRIGGGSLTSTIRDPVVIVPNPNPLHSRIRATWRPANGALGYFRRGSHDVVAVDNCVTLDPVLEIARKSTRSDRPAQALTNGTEVSLTGIGGSAGEIEFEVLGERILASAAAFFQASRTLLESFVGHVVEVTAPRPAESLLELYAGVGLLTVPLARLAGSVDSVESSQPAVSLAQQNLARAGLERVTCHVAPVGEWLKRQRRTRFECVVIDPPRTGLSSAVADWLTSSEPGKVTYVSCDPATFARDACRLVAGGLSLRSLRAFDLFPQTHHVELVAAFTRSS